MPRAHPLAAFALVIAAAVGWPSQDALACELCPADYELTAVEAAAEADLIAVVSRADAQPSQPEGLDPDEPDTIALTVHRVFKGEAEGTIVANSWDGMCSYGVIIQPNDDGRYLVMLDKRTDAWVQVHQGCAPFQLAVGDDDRVTIPNGKGNSPKRADATTVTLDALAGHLKLDAKPAATTTE